MSATVWLALSGDVNGDSVEGVFASYEGARRWLEEERERQITQARRRWEWERARWSPGSENLAKLKRDYPSETWDEFAAEQLAEPFAGMTEVEGDIFYDGRGDIHGSWSIGVFEVMP